MWRLLLWFCFTVQCTLCYSFGSRVFGKKSISAVAPPTTQVAAKVPVPDEAILESIFGEPTSQVTAVSSGLNDADADYWDCYSDFVPSQLEYDPFDWNLFKSISGSNDGNVVISPLGLKLALAVLTESASGATQNELRLALGLTPDRKASRNKFASILNSMKVNTKNFTLNLGSRVYVTKQTTPRQMFQAIAEAYYNTDIKLIDFENKPSASKEINQWVSDLTAAKIPTLVQEKDLDETTVMLLNVLYFEGAWAHQFQSNGTRAFYLDSKRSLFLPYMAVSNRFFCSESTAFDAKIIRLPYLGNKFAMYIVVPNAIMGLSKLLNGFSSTQLKSEIFYLQERHIDIMMPKFKFEFTSQLNSILYKMGIRQAFEDTASFPGLSSGQSLATKLRVSRVLQKSGIEVDELGSVAFSATEIMLENKFGGDDTQFKEIIINRPFLFFIEEETTRQILFSGRVMDPSAATGVYNGEPLPTTTTSKSVVPPAKPSS